MQRRKYQRKSRKVPPQTDIAYTAGIIDGEGHIGLYKQNPGYGLVSLRIVVQMACPKTVSWLAWRWSLGVFKSINKTNPKYKNAYVWIVRSADAEHILRLCLPYMITKRKHAHLAINSRKILGTRTGKRDLKKEKKIRDRAMGFRERMLMLNRRGPTPMELAIRESTVVIAKRRKKNARREKAR